MKKLQTYLAQYHNPKILDVGTGRGNFIQIIKKLNDNFSEIIGTDLDDRLLEINKASFKDDLRIKFVNDNILETKLSEGYFDVVCLSNTLHHLTNYKDTFDGMFKVLKDSGIIIVNETIADNLNPSQISHRKLHHFAAKLDREIGRVHDETFNKAELINRVKNLGEGSAVDIWDLDFENNEVDYDYLSYEKLIDRLLQTVNNKDNYPEFKTEAEFIKEYIKNNGFQSATQVVMIMKK
jgi:ubiquinone/menaquinone biosynthesis C-methylase UbiE